MCMGPEIAALSAALLPEAAAAGTAAGTTAAGTAAAGTAGLLAPAAAEGGGLLANSLYSSLLPGVGAEQAAALAAQTGEFGAAGLGKTMQAAASAQGLNPMMSGAAKIGGGLLGGGGAGTKEMMAAKMGLEMMQPQQPQRPPPGAPFQSQQGPLPNPYQRNALEGPPPGMTWEEWERRKQMMGGM